MNERLEIELDDITMQLIEAISNAEGISVEEFMKKAVKDFVASGKSDYHVGSSSTTL